MYLLLWIDFALHERGNLLYRFFISFSYFYYVFIFFVLLKFLAFIFSTDSLDLFYGLFFTFFVLSFLHVFVTDTVYRFF